MLARLSSPLLLLVVGLALAASAGFLTASALSASQQEPTKTVTINVATGPQGPPGPPGSPGAESCPDGYTFAAVLFNAPGGQRQIATCLKD